ncbi:TatD family hydrolase [Marinobacter sp.]|uniref:TatD family hydrolase n=1 Tax=Marinobacter sp. TaxID=50741 RepID=UPI002B48D3FC|nr:TatD family hydrolase [Marinobacter sp.]HKK55039.1 TatD family hydrolase [Marinobacter sp.]
MRFIDAHCHFDFPCFDHRRESVLEEARRLGLSHLVIPGVRRDDWDRVSRVASEYEGLYYCLGIHPWYVDGHAQSDLTALEQAFQNRPDHCVALGECGLDRLHGSLADQTPWFEAQIEIAARNHLPLVVHSVRTHDEVAEALKRKRFSGRVLVHGFAGSYQQACKLVDLGCFIGVGGLVTQERAKKTRDTLARLPVDSLILETDAPDMSPQGIQPGENSPVYLTRILAALAEVRGADIDQLGRALLCNVQRFYGWEEAAPSER